MKMLCNFVSSADWKQSDIFLVLKIDTCWYTINPFSRRNRKKSEIFVINIIHAKIVIFYVEYGELKKLLRGLFLKIKDT